MSLDPTTLLAIVGMAIGTYLTRIGGLVLVRRFPLRGRLAAGLEAVPGAILIAVIAPTVLATGIAETVAALVTVLMARRLPTLVAIIGGVGCVVLLRALSAGG